MAAEPEKHKDGLDKDGEVVSAEGEDLEQFDFASALQLWRKKKDRRIFTG